ncbi:MAG: HD domain-containing protein [Gemmatimonadota bacterium]|nr:HD domain-containing protein [Gemmatimonadota bacterium]MDE3215628.1 HD domain-containing protein [Gemmatimonadota bacterium]
MFSLRDPLWNTIPVDPVARTLIDTPPFQRLRNVRQLGLAYLVYPGATHTRFEHALGAYHLARRALALLEEGGMLDDALRADAGVVRAAALLHDIGHYPFSHALEEIGAINHEEIARPLVTTGEIGALLREAYGAGAPERIVALIRGQSDSPLQGLISGSLDLDKIEYLRRDAFMCGVPYGEIDSERLLNSLAVMLDPEIGRRRVGVIEKGLAALESLLFAKYQMYRNVYWHHASRSATVMYKRIVSDALDAGALDADTLVSFTDEELLARLERDHPSPLLASLRHRRLHKRSFECPAAVLTGDECEWMADDRGLVARVEARLEGELGLQTGELLLDYPAKTQMLGLDLPVMQRDGTVLRLRSSGLTGAIDLPKLSEELYRSARWLRVFTAGRTKVDGTRLLNFLRQPAAVIEERVAGKGKLLA